MFRKKVYATVLAAAAMLALSPAAHAQWMNRVQAARTRPARVYHQSQAPVAVPAAPEDLSDLAKQTLVGTWLINIPTTPESEGFFAFQTFHADGTLTENSSLLPTLTEGPAQGIWRGSNGEYNTTFELFAYEKGKPVGIIRVRCNIRVVLADSLAAHTSVDFIDLNGYVTEGIGGGVFSGQRVKLVKLQLP